MLDDGVYDALIIDATRREDNDASIAIDLTIVSGAHKGDVVSVRAAHFDGDELDLLGVPATLVVESGEPRVMLDR